MTAREFLTNLSIILGIMAIGALLETVVPMFAATPQGARPPSPEGSGEVSPKLAKRAEAEAFQASVFLTQNSGTGRA